MAWIAAWVRSGSPATVYSTRLAMVGNISARCTPSWIEQLDSLTGPAEGGDAVDRLTGHLSERESFRVVARVIGQAAPPDA